MNKLRSDSAFCQLTSEQVEALEGWLFEERLGYPQVLTLLKSEFGLETSLTGARRFYKRLEMERSRQSLMDAVEMGGLAVEALKSGTLKPGMLVLANKCAVELMMQSPPPVREVTALLRAITSAEAHAMKQTVFEREEKERRERELERKWQESWRMTPADLEEEREEQAATEKAAKDRENSSVAEAKAKDDGRVSALPTPEPTGSKEPAHPLIPTQWLSKPATSQLPQNSCALRATWSPSGGEGEDTAADQADGPATKDAGGAWQPSVLEEREYAEIYPAEEAENRLTPLNAA